MLPIITFIGSLFIFHLFDWMEATQVLVASIIGGLTIFLMIGECKDEYKDKIRKADLKQINLYVGVLTVLVILLFVNAVIHWSRLIDFTARFGILLLLTLIYLVILIRLIRILSDLKKSFK
jgi:hypothetical protein